MRVIEACFENIPPHHFWSLADEYPDLVTRMHTQVRLIRNIGLDRSVPWLKDTKGQVPYVLFVKRISKIWITCCLIVPSLKRILTPFGAT